MSVSLTWAFNVSGHPASSVPAGLAPDGVPVGLQLVARHGEEGLLLRVAAELERLAPWPAPAVVGADH
jgi:Asp-tRNA(Asn)/Glu-tRNA(Gln) amidotransferase A subunit family amidase